jgi:hypothetical protein
MPCTELSLNYSYLDGLFVLGFVAKPCQIHWLASILHLAYRKKSAEALSEATLGKERFHARTPDGVACFPRLQPHWNTGQRSERRERRSMGIMRCLFSAASAAMENRTAKRTKHVLLVWIREGNPVRCRTVGRQRSFFRES